MNDYIDAFLIVSLLSPILPQVQTITSNFDVQIKFPDRDFYDESAAPAPLESNEHGDIIEPAPITNNGVDTNGLPRPCDIIRITGTPENCRLAHQALIDLVPVSEEIAVPFDLHRSIIGQKGRDVRDLMSRFDVHIELSPQEQQLDVIRITGAAQNIAEAKVALEERVRELELDRKDRELRQFELTFEVDPEFHPKIIGRRGAVINKIRADHGVQIHFPRKDEEEENVIRIQGYEEAANAAKADILKIIDDLNELVKETVEIDNRVHARIIGQRGRGIKKIMDDFKVDIKFPWGAERNENQDLVTIIGEAEAVSDAKDHLLNMQEEYLQDVIDRPQAPTTTDFSAVMETAFKQTRTKSSAAAGQEQQGGGGGNGPVKKEGFVVHGAPWEQTKNKKAPNTSSQQDFPDFGLSAVTREAPLTSAWGQRH